VQAIYDPPGGIIWSKCLLFVLRALLPTLTTTKDGLRYWAEMEWSLYSIHDHNDLSFDCVLYNCTGNGWEICVGAASPHYIVRLHELFR
jgi:hypothetical protein